MGQAACPSSSPRSRCSPRSSCRCSCDKSERHQTWATIIAFALCAISVVVLTGWGGQLSLGQMAFAGLGALTAAALDPRAVSSTSAGRAPLPRRWDPGHPVPRGRCCSARCVREPRRGRRRHRRACASAACCSRSARWRSRSRRRPTSSTGPFFTAGSTTVQIPRGRPRPARAHPPEPRVLLLRASFMLVVVLVLVGHLRRTGIGRMIVGVRENELAASAHDGVAGTREAHRVRARRVHRRARRRAARRGEPHVRPSDDSATSWSRTRSDSSRSSVIGGLGSLTGAVVGALWVDRPARVLARQRHSCRCSRRASGC